MEENPHIYRVNGPQIQETEVKWLFYAKFIVKIRFLHFQTHYVFNSISLWIPKDVFVRECILFKFQMEQK